MMFIAMTIPESDCIAVESCEWHSDENACESTSDHDDHDDDENGLVISIANSDIVTITVEDNEENEANNQGNGIHINAVSAGSTNFTIQLMHEVTLIIRPCRLLLK